MTGTEPSQDPVPALLRRAVELDKAERFAAREQFLQRLDHKLEQPPGNRLVRSVVPLALAASVLLGLLLWKPGTSLEYTVQGAVRDGDYVQTAQDQPADITFSDHTQIHAAAGTRLRIDNKIGRHGARVSVERGRLDVAVQHAEHTDWKFDAGPFKVQVTGTRFALAWDADKEQLEVVLHAGAVDVTGYEGSIVSVRAGQRFLGDARQRTMLVSDTTLAVHSGAATSEEPQAEASAAAPLVTGATSTQSALTPSSVPVSRKPSWPELIAKGSFQRVVDEAGARGTSDCLASCNADDLSALADAARYVGRADLAEQALRALRSRYASSYGVRAAFLLGRLHESKGNSGAAKSWYETALQEGSGGAFAAEALAGKMRAVSTLEGRAAARAIAREYLRRYPDGVHAAAAKQLVENP